MKSSPAASAHLAEGQGAGPSPDHGIPTTDLVSEGPEDLATIHVTIISLLHSSHSAMRSATTRKSADR